MDQTKEAVTRPGANSFFIENVEEFMAQKDYESVLDTLDSEFKKFKFLESRLFDQKQHLQAKVPEIQRTLDIVRHLKAQIEEEQDEPLKTHFELTNGIFAEGTVNKENKKCYLWLGANVMVEYSYEEALDILTKNFESGSKALKKVTEDLEYLKDQITVTEVNIARIYNYGVKVRKTGAVATK